MVKTVIQRLTVAMLAELFTLIGEQFPPTKEVPEAPTEVEPVLVRNTGGSFSPVPRAFGFTA